MYVQTCIKGVHGINDEEARNILGGEGLHCGWWRRVGTVTSTEISKRLKSPELDLHVNAFDEKHPSLPGRVREETPFISLAAGSIERNATLKTNFVHPAHRTALLFASDFGTLRGDCYLFYCWVIVGLVPATPVPHLAEEVRELNTYRRYSAYQLEGEIAAKIEVSACQIHRFERYTISKDYAGLRIQYRDNVDNPDYVDPQSVVNIRKAF